MVGVDVLGIADVVGFDELCIAVVLVDVDAECVVNEVVSEVVGVCDVTVVFGVVIVGVDVEYVVDVEVSVVCVGVVTVGIGDTFTAVVNDSFVARRH